MPIFRSKSLKAQKLQSKNNTQKTVRKRMKNDVKIMPKMQTQIIDFSICLRKGDFRQVLVLHQCKIETGGLRVLKSMEINKNKKQDVLKFVAENIEIKFKKDHSEIQQGQENR